MNMKSFLFGIFVGSIVVGTAFSDAILPIWHSNSVTPVVVCQYDDMSYRFIPTDSDSLYPPSWKKEEVTPVVMTKYEFYHFVPMHGTCPMTLSWRNDEVTPWVELKYNQQGYFEPR